jgi:hypothetical protein
MKLPRRNFRRLAAGAAALPAISRVAWAQAYPSRRSHPSTSPNELNTTPTPHSIIHGDACFAYFNKIWGIPLRQKANRFVRWRNRRDTR